MSKFKVLKWLLFLLVAFVAVFFVTPWLFNHVSVYVSAAFVCFCVACVIGYSDRLVKFLEI